MRCYRHDVPDATRRALAAASLDAPSPVASASDLAAAAAASVARYAALLAPAARVQHTEAGPALYFPDDPSESDGSAVLVTEATAHLLRPLLPAWVPDVRLSAPLVALVALVRDGRAVAVCASVRITQHAHEAGIETAAAFRGRGFAAPVVAAWARAVRAGRRTPLQHLVAERLVAGGRAQAGAGALRQRPAHHLSGGPGSHAG